MLEMPGVDRKDIHVALENDVLRVEGKIDFARYQGMEPVYTEYNVGHYARSFSLSDKVDQEKITAQTRGRRADAHAAQDGGGPAAPDR